MIMKDEYGSDITNVIPKEEFSGDVKELDEKIKSMMGRGESMIKMVQSKLSEHMLVKFVGKRVLGIT